MIWFNALILSEAKLLFLSLNTNLGIAEPDKKAHILFWYTFSNLIVVIKLITIISVLKVYQKKNVLFCQVIQYPSLYLSLKIVISLRLI
jgi:hypothetical protein